MYFCERGRIKQLLEAKIEIHFSSFMYPLNNRDVRATQVAPALNFASLNQMKNERKSINCTHGLGHFFCVL